MRPVMPDPVAQRRNADLQVTLNEIDAALADRRRHLRRVHAVRQRHPEERLELRPFASRFVMHHQRRLTRSGGAAA